MSGVGYKRSRGAVEAAAAAGGGGGGGGGGAPAAAGGAGGAPAAAGGAGGDATSWTDKFAAAAVSAFSSPVAVVKKAAGYAVYGGKYFPYDKGFAILTITDDKKMGRDSNTIKDELDKIISSDINILGDGLIQYIMTIRIERDGIIVPVEIPVYYQDFRLSIQTMDFLTESQKKKIEELGFTVFIEQAGGTRSYRKSRKAHRKSRKARRKTRRHH